MFVAPTMAPALLRAWRHGHVASDRPFLWRRIIRLTPPERVWRRPIGERCSSRGWEARPVSRSVTGRPTRHEDCHDLSAAIHNDDGSAHAHRATAFAGGACAGDRMSAIETACLILPCDAHCARSGCVWLKLRSGGDPGGSNDVGKKTGNVLKFLFEHRIAEAPFESRRSNAPA